ncbi:hypothetical protein [Ahniella affigens]|nr:hypothetical protein [Ahniella affigens]
MSVIAWDWVLLPVKALLMVIAAVSGLISATAIVLLAELCEWSSEP